MTTRNQIVSIICASLALLLGGCSDAGQPESEPGQETPEHAAPPQADAATPQAAPATPVAPLLTEHGYGGIAIGAPAKGTPLVFDFQEEQYGCTYARLPGRDALYFMVIEGEVARIEIESATTRLPNGLGIGSTGEDILAAYPKAEISTNKYDYDASDYDVTLESGLGIVFMVSQGAVTSFRVGRFPEVGYVEGCS